MLVLFIFMISILPMTMIFIGRLWSKKGAGKVNNILGYKTKKSTRNQDTWDFAHKYFGKLWLRLGLLIYLTSLIALSISINITIIMYLQLIIFIGPIVLTEIKLSRTFDDDGIPL